MSQSIWKTQAKGTSFLSLNQDVEADVCIVGAGITGLTTAMQLKNSGKKVVVLEAMRIGDGTTGFSSNHLNTQIDFTYQEVTKKHNSDKAKIVAASRTRAIDYIQEMVEKHRIDCDFKRVNGYLYAEKEENEQSVEEEFSYCQRVGLEVSLADQIPLQLNICQAIVFARQAQFNSQQYLEGLSRNLGDNCTIYENSRVKKYIHSDNLLITENGSVTAKQVVLATHLPLFINIHQTTAAPYRSYMITAKLKEYPLHGLYWDSMDPYHYTRVYEQNGEKWLVVGGADHKTGHDDKDIDYFADLEQYVKARYPVESIEHRWSAQYYEPVDGLPFIGETPGGNTLMATGYSGDGLVYGTIAGIILADMIMEKENVWSSTYSSKRIPSISSGKTYIEENIDVAKHLIMDRLHSAADIDEIERGSGALVDFDSNRYALHKDEQGEIHVCSATCPHLGCLVKWNHMEKSWDCPCHGSRFSATGEIILGPATHDLKKIDVEEKVRG